MTNVHARLLALPLVMVAGSLYSMVREEFALLIGGLTFLCGAVLFIGEWVGSLRSPAARRVGSPPAREG
jgi:hypothetical protein